MNKDEFERALGYSENALSLLKRGFIPPYPKFYELLYTYASGVNPELNARINAAFKKGINPDAKLIEDLHAEFIHERELGEKLSSVSEEIVARIGSVHDAIGFALGNASEYSALLESASGDLKTEMDRQALQLLTDKLLEETVKMKAANKELEAKLETTRGDVSSLHAELEEVRRDSMLDPLTKIHNRKAFDGGIEDAVAEAEKSGESLSLLMLDIDFFKAFNDTYGHQTGDQVLRLVASTLDTNIREGDLAARYGGEEFAAILPMSEVEGAVKTAENVREAIQARKLHKRSTNEQLGRVTASIGVATFRSGDTVGSLIERADKCLYAAKGAGRNRVVDETDPLVTHIEDASVA